MAQNDNSGNDTIYLPEEDLFNANCQRVSPDYVNFYRMQGSYIPDANAPIKTIKVNINIWQKDDGSGNWQDTPEHRDRWKNIMAWLNGIYSDNQQPTHPVGNAPFIEDTKIRFEYQIFFNKNSVMYNRYGGIGHGHIYDNYLRDNYPERLKAINIHVIRYCGNYNGYAEPPGFNFNKTLYIVTRNNEEDPNNPDIEKDYALAMHLAHELGHSFDFNHTYDANYENCNKDTFDFLSDVFDLSDTSWCAPMGSCDICIHNGGWDCNPNDPTTHCTNNIMGGTSGARYFSPLQIGRIHRTLALKTTRNYVSCYSNQPYIISNNQTWDFSIKFYQDLVVDSGAVLTVKCEVEMVPEAKVIVKRGGKLVIDGGKFTNGVYDTVPWQGIEVWGNRDLSQMGANQGKVELINGAVIENARQAIATRKGDNNWNYNGGIVQATDAIFRNNWRDVEFLSYQNIVNGNEISNNSFFNNCVFQTTFSTLHTSHTAHVSLWQVNGVSFKGCRFMDSRGREPGYIKPERTGIFSQMSSFKINEYCSETQPFPAPPSCNGTRSSFISLLYAIRAYGLNTPSKSITIKNTDFTNNYRGIYLSGIDNTEILLNNFTIPLGNSSDNHSYGIYLDGGTNYQVEGNDFQGDVLGSKGASYGVVVKNTGSDQNQIYRNTFANLTIGIEAIGNNKGGDVEDGLEIRCNDFANGYYDVFVTPDITDGNTLPIGIRELQGTFVPVNAATPAGNLFGNSSPILVSNYKNQGEYITYISHNPDSVSRVVPSIYDVNSIGIVPTYINKDDQSCPDGTVTPEPRSGISEERTEAASEAAAIEAELAALVDNGNTELLEQEVLNTNTNNAYSSYNALLEVSPYISEEVLQTIGAKEEGLSNAMIRDIMVANPQAAKSEEVLGALDNRENQLSWYMRSQIEAGRTILGAKELLEIAYAIKATAYRDATGRGIRSIVHYEEDADLNELRAWLENLPEFEYRLLYAETWFAENDFQNGLQSLLGIAENMELTEMQQGIVNDYVLFYQNLESWSQNNPALTDLDEDAIALLQTLAVKDNSIGAKARNLLVINNVSDYEEPLYLPLEERNSAANAPVIVFMPEVENTISFKVYPNPARDYFTIEWCGLGEEIAPNSKVIVSGMDGRSISEVKVNEACNQKIIDTRSWASGNYTLSLLVDGIIVKTLKLNISK